MNMNNNILHVMPGIAVLNSEKFKVISHMRDTLDYGLVSMPIWWGNPKNVSTRIAMTAATTPEKVVIQ